jgi:FKBP-type peptidyl-prolyl cis-trans isomerase
MGACCSPRVFASLCALTLQIQGQGAALREGDAAYIQYTVFRINGDYMFSLGKGAELQHDEGSQYRLVLGAHQVPQAVELAIAGMREGGKRKIVVPPNLGWAADANQLPLPATFSGKRKLELYREQPLMFEVELQRVIPKNKSKQ